MAMPLIYLIKATSTGSEHMFTGLMSQNFFLLGLGEHKKLQDQFREIPGDTVYNCECLSKNQPI